jgi:hypothetical protein
MALRYLAFVCLSFGRNSVKGSGLRVTHLQDGFDLLGQFFNWRSPNIFPLILSETLLTELNREILNSLPISSKLSPRSDNKVEIILILSKNRLPPSAACSLHGTKHPDILFSSVWTQFFFAAAQKMGQA